jgi:hypothetical protein
MATSRREIEEELQRRWMENAGVAQLFGFTAGASFDDVYARVSVVRLLMWVVSYVIAAKETAYEDWEEEVRAVADATHYGTEAWWVETAKAWQEGDALTVADGRVRYATVDATHRVVTSAAISTLGRTLRLKVAKGEPGGLQALTTSQLEAFQGYVESVKPVGLHVTVTSGSANVIGMSGTVRYSAELNQGDVRQAVREKLTAVMGELPFGGRLYAGRLAAAMMAVEGVEDVNLTVLTVDGQLWTDWTEPSAGYCVPGPDELNYEGVVR